MPEISHQEIGDVHARQHAPEHGESPWSADVEPDAASSPLSALSLLAGQSLPGRGSGEARASAFLQLQHTHGNRAVQRLAHGMSSHPTPVQRFEGDLNQEEPLPTSRNDVVSLGATEQMPTGGPTIAEGPPLAQVGGGLGGLVSDVGSLAGGQVSNVWNRLGSDTAGLPKLLGGGISSMETGTGLSKVEAAMGKSTTFGSDIATYGSPYAASVGGVIKDLGGRMGSGIAGVGGWAGQQISDQGWNAAKIWAGLEQSVL